MWCPVLVAARTHRFRQIACPKRCPVLVAASTHAVANDGASVNDPPATEASYMPPPPSSDIDVNDI